MTISITVGSYRHSSAFAALVLVLLSRAGAVAAELPPANVSAKAGTARVASGKPSGPTPMVRRGLILSPGLLDPYVGPFVDRPVDGDARRMGTSLGLLWGFAKEVHVDLQLGPLYVLPGDTPTTGRATVTGRLIKSRPVDLGASFMAVFDPGPSSSLLGYVQPGLPAILRPNERLRIDTGVHVPVYTTDDPHLGLRVPLNVYVQVTDRYHIGGTSALLVTDLRDARTNTSIPFGFTAGYSAGPDLSFLAITPYFTWTQFYRPAEGALDTRAFVAGVVADFIVDLR